MVYKHGHRRRAAFLGCSFATFGFCSHVGAQEAQPEAQTASHGLEEIVVTATRREETIQSIPMSITAITEVSLENRAATQFFDYASGIPNLSFGYSGGGQSAGLASSRQVAIRGIAGDGTTAFYIDDTPVPVSIDPQAVDVAQIEVLRGPQGTLYGALSMGGTLRVLTEQPDTQHLEILAHGSVSSTDHAAKANYQTDGSLNLPLIDDKLAIRFSGYHEELGGYFKRYAEDTGGTINDVGQTTIDGGQVAMLWKITDDLSVTPRVIYQRTELNGLPFSTVNYNASSLTPIIIRPTSLVQVESFDIPESSSDQWTLTSLDFKYHQSFGTFVFSSSDFDRRTTDVEDQTLAIAQLFGIAPLPTSITDFNHPRIQTEELRFASSFSGPFQLVSGFYYEHTNTSGVGFPPNYVRGLNAATGGTYGTDLVYSYNNGRDVQIETAPYAEANYDITEHWRATAGIRSTRIESLLGPVTADGIANGGPTTVAETSSTQTTITPKYSLQYRLTPDNQIYATVAKGFRPGSPSGGVVPQSVCGADLAALGLKSGVIGPVQPDTVWSYELGEKTAWLDKRLTVDFDVFRINWDQIQQTVLLACGFPFDANAGAARSQGAEIDINAQVMDDLTLEVSAGYDDAKFTQTVPGVLFQSGDRIPQVPRESAQFDADYNFTISSDVSGFAHADYRYVGNSWSTNNALTNPNTGSVIPLIRPSYRIADLRGGVKYGKTEYALFIKNLTNEYANLSDTNAISLQAIGQSRVAISPPRTIGLEFRYRY
jgi:iron complex outermembrane recepter protein